MSEGNIRMHKFCLYMNFLLAPQNIDGHYTYCIYTLFKLFSYIQFDFDFDHKVVLKNNNFHQGKIFIDEYDIEFGNCLYELLCFYF